ncbi:PAX-interacting protein 1 isoform X2 [Nilaparvata lugens]|uniref:PAX-interacting protein 1 isoform X2 n=1 Tax=Nilaparvata lugens TaxID=108931 RepID=UPI00193DEE12|nr:PAX-interacting protein 1 isoform X2 [Nilaparvata lugens]
MSETGEKDPSEEALFKSVKYKISGTVSQEVIDILKNGGAESFAYFSDYVTICLVGDDPSDSDITDANDLYEIPAVSSNWVTQSKKFNKLLPTKYFEIGDTRIFAGIVATVSNVSSEDAAALWAMLFYNGARFQARLTPQVTHLVTTKASGKKYEQVTSSSEYSKCFTVTPDWIIDSLQKKSRCSEENYHPRLLVEKSSPVSKITGSLSTAHITGFADEEVPAEESNAAPTLSNELLQQLKQRMPWNQPAVSTQASTHQPTATQTMKLAQTRVVSTQSQPPPLQPTLQQPQQQARLLVQQHLLQPTQWRPPPSSTPQLQSTQTQIVQGQATHIQQQIHQQLQHHQMQQQSAQQQAAQQQAPQQQQAAQQQQQLILQPQQQLINHQQKIQLPGQTQFIVRENQQQGQQFVSAHAQIPWQQQTTQQQQQQQQQQQYQLRQQQGQQQQQRITYTQGGSATPPRQLIHMDAQTHAQLQQMDPQQRALFLQNLQKQRQLVLQRQMQAQQSGRIRQGGTAAQVAVISSRGCVAQPVAQPVQWVQHRQQHHQIFIPHNSQLRQQVLLQGEQGQQLRSPQQQAVVTSVVASGTPSPATNTAAGQWQESPSVIASQQQQQQQLAQLKLRQQHAQIQRLQQIKQMARPATMLYANQGVQGQPQQQTLVVNAKTKTALANMLSIRLQAGQGQSQGHSSQLEGSASGQLRLMTAQHHAQQQCNQVQVQTVTPNPAIASPATPTPTATNLQRTSLVNVTNANVNNQGAYSTQGSTAARVAAVLAKSAAATAPTATQLHPRAHFYGHNPTLKLPPDMCLLGCVFLIVEYDRSGYDVSTWQRVILENGGEYESAYSLRVTHILCQTQKHPLVQQGLRDGKRCITADWLSDITLKQQVLPPWLALHFPTPFSDEKPCRNLIISYTGFEGEERIRVKKMIEVTGAKVTSYYTSHNHILICRRPDGEKYKKAREWGKSVVNVQWLNEILFGHYSCLQQADSHKYQQFNLGNPFRIDYALVPHLMGAWKIPINVMQESYDRVKSSPPLNNRRKRIKFSNTSSTADAENQENKEVNVTNANVSDVKDDQMDVVQPCIMFSGVEDVGVEQKKVLQLGGAVATSCREATHLLVPKLTRTFKLLCCLSTCKYILKLDWLRDSHKHNTFIDEKQYIISDDEFEKIWDCNIEKVLSYNNRTELFKGKTFFFTPGVIPSRSFLREITEYAGGTVQKQRKSLKAIQDFEPNTYFIIGHSNDLHLIIDVLRANIGVYNADFIMTSIMKQKIDLESSIMKFHLSKK